MVRATPSSQANRRVNNGVEPLVVFHLTIPLSHLQAWWTIQASFHLKLRALLLYSIKISFRCQDCLTSTKTITWRPRLQVTPLSQLIRLPSLELKSSHRVHHHVYPIHLCLTTKISSLIKWWISNHSLEVNRLVLEVQLDHHSLKRVGNPMNCFLLSLWGRTEVSLRVCQDPQTMLESALQQPWLEDLLP